jgi:hypothetical protein
MPFACVQFLEGLVSTLTKRINIYFQKLNMFFNFEIIYFSIIYSNIVI